MKKPKVIELLINEDIEEAGVELISFVKNPAIKVDFMYFSEETEKEVKDFSFKVIDNEKRIVTGPALIPNQYIKRIDDITGEEFFVFFSEETVRKTSQLFFKRDKQHNANLEHSTEVNGVTVVESWLIEDESIDKAVALGYVGLPVGTWMVTYKLENDDVIEMIKNGEVMGFSIEGGFLTELVESALSEQPNDEFDEIVEILKSDKTEEEIFDILEKKLNK